MKKDFVHYDAKKSLMLDENLPLTKTSKKYGLASVKVFKWTITKKEV